jgi:hypothetical protein
MQATPEKRTRRVLVPLAWCVAALLVGAYAAFALSMGFSELAHLLGLGPEVKYRATPVVFVVHALAGTVALVVAPLQSIRWIRRRLPVRLALGRTYVAAVWLTCLSAAVDALSFNVTPAARALFIGIAAAWCAATTVGMLRALARRFAEQHEWMLRSCALALFFVTFSPWRPALEATSLPSSIAYPLSQLLGAAVNLAIAELYIRRTRRTRRTYAARKVVMVGAAS